MKAVSSNTKTSLSNKESSDISFHIETLGCPKNKVDSRRMKTSLLQAGYRQASSAEESDLLLINSCSFIKEAQEETINTVFNALNLKKEKSKPTVGLVGCFAERFSSAINEEIPELDFIVGTGRYHEIADILSENFSIKKPIHALQNLMQNSSEKENPYAYFRIASGCSRSCSFCILPTIRGPLMPQNLIAIEEQYKNESMLRQTTPLKEVILVSQDTISQGVDDLEEIIAYFSDKPEIEWIRLQYLFPDKRVLKLIKLFEKYDKLVSYLDIPFQHASPNVLKSMNRPYDIELFKDIIAAAHQVRPNLEVRTSFILGYPTEDKEDVELLKNFLHETQIDKMALFRYSHEEGTPAEKIYADSIDEQLKVQRINELRSLHLDLRKERRQKLAGSIERVLVDEVNANEIVARREQDSPDIDEVVLININSTTSIKTGDFLSVELQMPMEYDWIGSLNDNT